jgi:hypothetical protein
MSRDFTGMRLMYGMPPVDEDKRARRVVALLEETKTEERRDGRPIAIVFETTTTVRVSAKCSMCLRRLTKSVIVPQQENVEHATRDALESVAKEVERRGWTDRCGQCKDPDGPTSRPVGEPPTDVDCEPR